MYCVDLCHHICPQGWFQNVMTGGGLRLYWALNLLVLYSEVGGSPSKVNGISNISQKGSSGLGLPLSFPSFFLFSIFLLQHQLIFFFFFFQFSQGASFGGHLGFLSWKPFIYWARYCVKHYVHWLSFSQWTYEGIYPNFQDQETGFQKLSRTFLRRHRY